MTEIEVTYDGPYNVVVECTDCGTERGSSVVTGTLHPERTTYDHCETCGGYRDHEPVREAERGEYDGHLICDDCDQQFTNTMDVDLHDCPADAEDSEDDDEDEPEAVTDGGEDVTAHVSDEQIEAALDQHEDGAHPDDGGDTTEALSVADVRGLLARVQQSVGGWWGEWVDSIERGDTTVVAETDDLLVFDTGTGGHVYRESLQAVAPDLDDLDISQTQVNVVMQVYHQLAREHSDHDWSATYPLVIRKPPEFDAGQQYVEAVVNGLQRRGLTPGQAWAYYGVEIRGYSRNQWGKRKGDHDHKNVSDALEKANKKLGA